MENKLIYNNTLYRLVECDSNRWRTHVENEEQRIKLDNIGYPSPSNPMVYEINSIKIKDKYYGLIPENNG